MAVMQVMTPREIVSELDRYIVGQHDAMTQYVGSDVEDVLGQHVVAPA